MFKIVVLDNPYQCFNEPWVKCLFAEMVELRLNAYGPDYPKSFLPMDLVDYVARHYLICEENINGGPPVPFAGFRHISLQRLDYYDLPMPLLTAAQKSGAHAHEQALCNMIQRHRENGTNLVYSSSFTIKKSYRKREGLSAFIRELVAALIFDEYRTDQVSEIVCGSALRFKTRDYFEQIGFNSLNDANGAELPVFLKGKIREQITLMRLEQTSQWSQECLEKHLKLIQNKILFSVPNEEKIAA